MAAHDASKAVRASVTTVPSFLNQNGLMYGVIRRQDIDKRGLTIGCKTAMVSNRTAITLQRVSDRLRPSQIALPKHISQRRHSAGSCAPEGHIKQFVEEVSGETKVYWPSQSGETGNLPQRFITTATARMANKSSASSPKKVTLVRRFRYIGVTSSAIVSLS